MNAEIQNSVNWLQTTGPDLVRLKAVIIYTHHRLLLMSPKIGTHVAIPQHRGQKCWI